MFAYKKGPGLPFAVEELIIFQDIVTQTAILLQQQQNKDFVRQRGIWFFSIFSLKNCIKTCAQRKPVDSYVRWIPLSDLQDLVTEMRMWEGFDQLRAGEGVCVSHNKQIQ